MTREPADTPAPAQLPRGTVTFLFTDVEGSTVGWIRNPSAMGAALARHDEVIAHTVARCGGVLVRPRGEGDSRFAVFSRATDAVVAASDMQIALCREAWPTDSPLRVRVALHTGEADIRTGDYYGPAVNHCARLRAIAHGGQVLVSSVTANLVRESLVTGISLLDLGEHLLKDLVEPERVWQLLHPELPAAFPSLVSREGDRRGAELGKLVRRHRLATGLSQEDLADKAGLSVRGLSDLERGVRSAPHPDSIRRIANALGLQGEDRFELLGTIPERDRAFTESSTLAERSSASKSKSFGAILRQRRLAAGLSQDELAQRSGLSRRGLADLERGARNYPHGDTVRRIAEALGLSQSDTAALIASGQRSEPSTSISRYSLPAEPVAMVGRDHEISELQLILKSARLVTLAGPGGIGKTRLALELARRVEADYDNGAVLVDLAPVGEPSGVVRAVAQALEIREEPNRSLMDTIRDHLAIRQVLVILDNCEHVLDGGAQLADWLVRHCPEVRIVATSREPMRVAPEVTWQVPPLRLEHARELFVQRAHAAHAALHLTDDDHLVVSEICQELEGIPLAIELAAARVPTLALRQIRDRLTQRLRLLSGAGRLTSARHQTLRAAIDWSYGLLLERERQLFDQLAVFSGGWELGALEHICATDTLASFEILDVLTELVRKSLVIVDLGPDRTRYRLLETIREYASERLETGRRSETRLRHIAYYRALAEPGALTRRGMRYAADMQHLRREHNNLRAALSSALELGELNEGLKMCCVLGGFWLSQGFLDEAQRWFEAFLERTDEVNWETVADGFFNAGRVAEYSGAFGRARDLHQHSLDLALKHDDVPRAVRALYGLGDVSLHHGEYEAAERYLERGLAWGRGMGPNSGLAEALISLATIAEARGEPDVANERLEESLGIQRALGDKWGIAFALNELGQRVRRQGELERAQSIHEESYELWRQSGTRMGQRAALMNLALIGLDRGHLAEATARAQAALEICREMADVSATTVRCVEIAARVLQVAGSSSVASTLLGASSAQRDSLGAPVPRTEQAEYATLRQAAAECLSETVFQLAHATGMQMTIDEAVDLATTELTGLEPRLSM
jgi:predicted ATPase/class 3 adenylate cyclase/ribosome-binding protein aMBF1 (putative translation factor)